MHGLGTGRISRPSISKIGSMVTESPVTESPLSGPRSAKIGIGCRLSGVGGTLCCPSATEAITNRSSEVDLIDDFLTANTLL